MTGRLEGKRVLVTGAGAGMGRATALRFADEGAAALALFDRVPERLESLRADLEPSGVGVVTQVVELADHEAVRECTVRAIDSLGGLDAVVSNAGMSAIESFLEANIATVERIFAVNFTAGLVIGQVAARHMVTHGGGVLLYTAATCDTGGVPEVPVYSASKAALINLVRSASSELGPLGVRINAVSPGFTRTSMSGDMDLPVDWSERADAVVAPQLPLRRQGRPEDVAAAFAFLASDDAAYITGANILVDGGLSARTHWLKWA